MEVNDKVIHIESGGLGTIVGHADPSGHPMVDFGCGSPSKLPPYELARVLDFTAGILISDMLVKAGAVRNRGIAISEMQAGHVMCNTGALLQDPNVFAQTGLYMITVLNNKGVGVYHFCARVN